MTTNSAGEGKGIDELVGGGGGIKGQDGNSQGSAEDAAGDSVSVREKMNTRLKSGKTTEKGRVPKHTWNYLT